jgi:lipoprotein-anchoring transpeptidase ErfK/SrfK
LGDTNRLYTTATVTASDHAALTPYPSSWEARSRQSAMGYETIEEMMAERYHLYQAALRRINPSVQWPNPPERTILTVPNLNAKRLPKLSKLTISLSEKTLQAFNANGQLVAHFPCSIAADKAKRPSGTLFVVVWAENPDYTFDPKLFADDPNAAHINRKLRIPPGPNNPVGVAWIGLDLPGYGIHGTPAPESISHTESHGCFRLTNWDAKKLVRAIYKNLPVEILP